MAVRTVVLEGLLMLPPTPAKEMGVGVHVEHPDDMPGDKQ